MIRNNSDSKGYMVMYNKILVPLDGSELAEAALPHAKSIANAFNSQIVLLTVIEPLVMYAQPDIVAPEINMLIDIEAQTKAVLQYLKGKAEELIEEGLVVTTEISNGPAANRICDYAAENAIDLIVMCTHGRSGFQRWVYGSVADRVLRAASMPILLVRIKEKQR